LTSLDAGVLLFCVLIDSLDALRFSFPAVFSKGVEPKSRLRFLLRIGFDRL